MRLLVTGYETHGSCVVLVGNFPFLIQLQVLICISKMRWDLSSCQNGTMQPLDGPDGGHITAAAAGLQRVLGDVHLGLWH